MPKILSVQPTSTFTIPLDTWQAHGDRLRVLLSEFGVRMDTKRFVDDDTKYVFDAPLEWTEGTGVELAQKLAEFL